MKISYSAVLQFAFLLLIAIWWDSASHPHHEEFVPCLLNYTDSPSDFSKAIYTQNNSSFMSVLDSYIQNLRFLSPEIPKPRVIITALTENQIQAAIFCSKMHRLQMRIRSGGHDLEGTSFISDIPFFVLDMSNFRSTAVDANSLTAWVGAGATLGELYYSIHEANSSLGFPAGTCPTVGIGGHISGGGYGPLTRQFGLAADNVIDARIIDANGKVLDRKSMGEDLFWAIRGGGGASFAAILGYKLKLVEIPEKVTAFSITRTLEQDATQLVYEWQYIASKLPLDLTITLQFVNINSDQTGKRTVQVRFVSVFLGKVDELFSIMNQQFPELGLKKEDCSEMLWIQYIAFHNGQPIGDVKEFLTRRGSRAKLYSKDKSDFAKEPIPEKGLEEILEKLNELPPSMAIMEWSYFGGGVMDTIPETATPFPHRGNLYLIFVEVLWNATNQEVVSKQRIDWIKKLYKVIGKYVPNNPRAAYANNRDLDLGVNNKGKTSVEKARIWGAPYFKNNFDRLVEVKTKVDPYNFFKNEQSIPPLH
ncbi:berberine bridge enzyme-like 8 [Coffea eugenioides]|uniref:berberine bridge enzyme-like 8 n=1 Tax=Coffea eugenioides TaxID=49369 RepID=UPI000F6064B4|nr:berberine bridge enzyme-like 8 [Coffea eugenioides]XP_027185070.1 berberine bridge enzyme-like 8 [Coffea eugenioides]